MKGNAIFEKQFLSREFKEWSYAELEIDLTEEKKVNVSEVKLTLTKYQQFFRSCIINTSMLIVYKSGHYFRIIHYNMMYWWLFRSCLSLQQVKEQSTLP